MSTTIALQPGVEIVPGYMLEGELLAALSINSKWQASNAHSMRIICCSSCSIDKPCSHTTRVISNARRAFDPSRDKHFRSPMGMNAPGAEQNFQFVLNVLLELHPKSSCAFTFGASRSPLRGEDEVLALYDGAAPHTPAFATQMPLNI
jgi:hypothetical protein